MKHVQSCLHPKIITNPYTGEKISVPCGHCDVCVNQRASLWTTRLDMEAASHKYTLFCTLTYSDDFVPQLVRFDDEEKPHCYVDPETGEVFDLYDIKETFENRDWKYFHSTNFLNVLSNRDIQLFLKRLRFKVSQINKNEKIRYYFGGEYGPRTFRPHWHGLLFFDSDTVCSQIGTLLSESWFYGDVYKPHLVSGSAAQYCASYINSLSKLPKIYHHRKLRPHSLFSKSPAIGSMYPLLPGIQELFNSGADEFTFFRPSSNEFVSFPLLRSIESRLYPRCQRFSSLSSSDRVALYRLAEGFQTCDSALEVAKRIKSEYIDRPRSDFFGRYFTEITKKYKFKYHFLDREIIIPWQFKNLPFLPLNFVVQGDMKAIKVRSYDFCFDSLVRFARTIMRVASQASAFGISIADYVSKIEFYYSRHDKKKLVDYFNYLDQYFKTRPQWHMVYMDFSFYHYLTTTDSNCWSPETVATVSNWFVGDVPLKICSDGCTVLDVPPLESLPDYQDMKLFYEKVTHDLTKQKSNNDYALSRKDKFKNILEYQNLI